MGERLDKILERLGDIFAVATCATALARYYLPYHPQMDYAAFGLFGLTAGYIIGSAVQKYLNQKRSYY